MNSKVVPKSGATVTYGVTLTNGKHVVGSGKYLVLVLTGETAAAGTMACTAGTASSTTTAVLLPSGLTADTSISCHFGVLVSSTHAVNGQVGAFNVTAVFASNQDGSGNLGDAFYIPSVVGMDPVTVNTGAMLSAATSEVVDAQDTYYTGQRQHDVGTSGIWDGSASLSPIIQLPACCKGLNKHAVVSS